MIAACGVRSAPLIKDGKRRSGFYHFQCLVASNLANAAPGRVFPGATDAHSTMTINGARSRSFNSIGLILVDDAGFDDEMGLRL